MARGQGESAHRRARRRDAGDLARVHEQARRHRQLQAHRRPDGDFADGDLGDPCARHRDVVHGGEDSGRMLRPLDRQGLGARLPGHRRHRRHDHVLRRQRLSPQYFLGAAGNVAGRGLQPRDRDDRHRGRAHHRRHPSRHGARGLGAAERRLCAGRAPAGGFHGQLSARRHGAGQPPPPRRTTA